MTLSQLLDAELSFFPLLHQRLSSLGCETWVPMLSRQDKAVGLSAPDGGEYITAVFDEEVYTTERNARNEIVPQQALPLFAGPEVVRDTIIERFSEFAQRPLPSPDAPLRDSAAGRYSHRNELQVGGFMPIGVMHTLLHRGDEQFHTALGKRFRRTREGWQCDTGRAITCSLPVAGGFAELVMGTSESIRATVTLADPALAGALLQRLLQATEPPAA